MYKILKRLVLVGLLFCILTPLVFAEDITITTYYPSPNGSYNRLKTNRLAVGSSIDVSTLGDGDLAVSGKIDRLEGMSFTLLEGWNSFKWLGPDISPSDLKTSLASVCGASNLASDVFRYDGSSYRTDGILRAGEWAWVKIETGQLCHTWNRADRGGLPIILDPYYITTAHLAVRYREADGDYAAGFYGGGVYFEQGLNVAGLLPFFYANNAAAKAGGLKAGDLYRTGGDPDYVCVVH